MTEGKRQLMGGLPSVCCSSRGPLPRERKRTSVMGPAVPPKEGVRANAEDVL
jgi:hypothetical protein